MTMRTALGGFCVAITVLNLGCAADRVEVTQYGDMHAVLSGGGEKAAGIVNVGDVLERPNAIAVGALAGLEGEITICDGEAWIARPAGRDLHVEGPVSASTEQAALMTVSHVDNWRETPIDRDLAGEALEQFIYQTAAAQGVDTSKPFPFMLGGDVVDVKLHVINGDCPMRPGVGLTADEQPWRMMVNERTHGRIVGFYASDSVGKLTHPGTSIHAHVLMQDRGRDVTGHVERIAMARGGVLKLPMVE